MGRYVTSSFFLHFFRQNVARNIFFIYSAHTCSHSLKFYVCTQFVMNLFRVGVLLYIWRRHTLSRILRKITNTIASCTTHKKHDHMQFFRTSLSHSIAVSMLLLYMTNTRKNVPWSHWLIIRSCTVIHISRTSYTCARTYIMWERLGNKGSKNRSVNELCTYVYVCSVKIR